MNKSTNDIVIATEANESEGLSHLQIQHKNGQNTSPFFHPVWFKQWLLSSMPLGKWLSIQSQQTIDCSCFIGFAKQYPWLPFKSAFLNQAGEIKKDQAWIEYNDIFADETPESTDTAKALLSYLFTQKKVSNLNVSMTTQQATWVSAANEIGADTETEAISGYVKNLDTLKCVDEVIATLSSNTRSKVRRSIKKLIAEHGAIQIETAITEAQKIAFYNGLSSFHISQWQQTEQGSGFSNAMFNQLQKNLLNEQPNFACINKVSCGSLVLGYAIFYLHNNTAYFYCSGVNHTLSNTHIKPGYVMHVYLMAEFAQNGYSRYDFLGGESQYKQSLADEQVTFHRINIIAPNFRGKMLQWLKQLKRSFG